MKNSKFENTEVIFLDENTNDINLIYSVIVARYNGRWVLCRHKDRTTFEVPGGHIEKGESPEAAAKRELYEETGTIDFDIIRVCTYGVRVKNELNYGALFFADIKALGDLPEMEIEEVVFYDSLPKNLTYPHIQPLLFDYVKKWLDDLGNYKKKYKAIIFDLDGTLFDHFGAVERAVEELYVSDKIFNKMHMKKFKTLYDNIQRKYFIMYRDNSITWSMHRIMKIKALYSHFGLDLDDEESNEKFEIYLKLYEKHWALLDNAYDLLKTLKANGYIIGMITNGESVHQYEKINSQKILSFFDNIIVSSEHDFAKPDNKIFELALRELKAKSSEALYIGDSIKSDIQGANNANIDSVYIVREHNKDNSVEFKPTYTISNLNEILPLIDIKMPPTQIV